MKKSSTYSNQTRYGYSFLYLSEYYKPGQLDSFRWGHFLLLAITYSLFFIIVAVLGFQDVPILWSAIIAAAFSLPLLTLHVRAILDSRFAVTYNLPLAVFTIGMVLNGVYGGDYISNVWLGGIVFVIGFFTFTFEQFLEGKNAQRLRLNQSTIERVNALISLAGQVTEIKEKSEDVHKKYNHTELKDLKSQLKQTLENTNKYLNSFAEISDKAEDLPGQTDTYTVVEERRAINRQAKNLEKMFPKSINWLHELNEKIEEKWAIEKQKSIAAEKKAKLAELKRQESTKKENASYCIDCGHKWQGSMYCPHCGTAQPETKKCQQCDNVIKLPVHLLDRKMLDQKQEWEARLHCIACGSKYR